MDGCTGSNRITHSEIFQSIIGYSSDLFTLPKPSKNMSSQLVLESVVAPTQEGKEEFLRVIPVEDYGWVVLFRSNPDDRDWSAGWISSGIVLHMDNAMQSEVCFQVLDIARRGLLGVGCNQPLFGNTFNPIFSTSLSCYYLANQAKIVAMARVVSINSCQKIWDQALGMEVDTSKVRGICRFYVFPAKKEYPPLDEAFDSFWQSLDSWDSSVRSSLMAIASTELDDICQLIGSMKAKVEANQYFQWVPDFSKIIVL